MSLFSVILYQKTSCNVETNRWWCGIVVLFSLVFLWASIKNITEVKDRCCLPHITHYCPLCCNLWCFSPPLHYIQLFHTPDLNLLENVWDSCCVIACSWPPKTNLKNPWQSCRSEYLVAVRKVNVSKAKCWTQSSWVVYELQSSLQATRLPLNATYHG